MTIARRLGRLERGIAEAPCPACVDAPSCLLIEHESEVLPRTCVACGREIRCFTVIGAGFEATGLPKERLAEIHGQIDHFRQRQRLA